MKPAALVIFLTGLFFAGAGPCAASETPYTITIQSTVKFLGPYDAPGAATEVTYLGFVRGSVSKGD